MRNLQLFLNLLKTRTPSINLLDPNHIPLLQQVIKNPLINPDLPRRLNPLRQLIKDKNLRNLKKIPELNFDIFLNFFQKFIFTFFLQIQKFLSHRNEQKIPLLPLDNPVNKIPFLDPFDFLKFLANLRFQKLDPLSRIKGKTLINFIRNIYGLILVNFSLNLSPNKFFLKITFWQIFRKIIFSQIFKKSRVVIKDRKILPFCHLLLITVQGDLGARVDP